MTQEKTGLEDAFSNVVLMSSLQNEIKIIANKYNVTYDSMSFFLNPTKSCNKEDVLQDIECYFKNYHTGKGFEHLFTVGIDDIKPAYHFK